MSRGFTLVELLLVLALLGVVLGLALPSFGALRDRLAVAEATDAIVRAHARARTTARAERRLALLVLTADSLVLRVLAAPGDTLERWRDAGPNRYGVTVTGLPRTVLVAPTGVTIGLANGTYALTRGAWRREVIVSRYGRVRVQ